MVFRISVTCHTTSEAATRAISAVATPAAAAIADESIHYLASPNRVSVGSVSEIAGSLAPVAAPLPSKPGRRWGIRVDIPPAMWLPPPPGPTGFIFMPFRMHW
ncbi:hypothetical protein FMUAM8_56330 [Nocardia cyriacigeorgica]|nr:hypothetical protein FMUAM8_56330 [Nocardia cyriacigeorgica]